MVKLTEHKQNTYRMERILSLVLIYNVVYISREVGCMFVNNTATLHVVAGQDAHLNWNYVLQDGEKIQKIFLGYYNKSSSQKPVFIAYKQRNQTIIRNLNVPDRYKDDATIVIDDNSKVELTLPQVQTSTDDKRTYFVKFIFNTNKDGSDETEVTWTTEVIVIVGPVFRGRSKSPTAVEENGEVSLSCKADGKPHASIKWFKQGNPDVLESGVTSKNLKLKNLKRTEGGNYTCIASNLAGQIAYTVLVIVQYKPKINLQLSSKRIGTYINNPSPVCLVCVASGLPLPIYKWNNPLRHEIMVKASEGRFILQQPNNEDIGPYTCEASNSVGSATHTVEVYGITKPHPIQMNVTKVERRSAIVLLKIPTNPGGGIINELLLSYKPSGKNKKKELTFNSSKIHLIDLIPYTNYELNVTVRNEYFVSDGQNRSFKTKEAPPGPPSNIIIHVLSPYTLKVSWEAPVEKNGVITKYKVMFFNSTDQSYRNLSTVLTSLELQYLKPYTEYNAKVKATTNAGDGKWSLLVKNKTEPEVPGVVKNVSVTLGSTLSSIIVSWMPPVSVGVAPLTKYKINVTCISKEDQRKSFQIYTGKVEPDEASRLYEVISKLFPYSICHVSICEGAGSTPRWGQYITSKTIVMPEAAPGKPKNLEFQSASHDHLVFHWERPDHINGVLKKYTIQYENASGTYNQNLVHNLSNKTFNYTLSYLNDDTTYTIKVIAHTQNHESKPIEMKMKTTRASPRVLAVQHADESNAGPILGGVFTVVFIILLAGGILLYIIRRKKRFNKSHLNGSDAGFFQKGGDNINLVDGLLNSPSTKDGFMMNGYVKNAQCTFSPKNPIPITSLKDLVQKYHVNKAKGFIEEFRSIKSERVGSLEVSSRTENKCKNRYANILAYDHSRVVLNTVEDLEGSDYVNANYIDGYNKKAKFIATQGPVVAAFNDFWRMIWEQDASKIIMVTNLVEKSRIKCQKYWPCENEKAVLYGNIKVQLIDELHLAEYVLRRFSISQMKNDVQVAHRTVTQYQFLSWPDHGVPQYPTALLQFVKRVRVLDQGTTGPIVCHCSAGVGRTGTYITLDAMLDQIESEKTVDVLGYVTHIRGQRQLMVQTEAQYIYIYDTLLEAVSCGNTEVNTTDLFTRIKHLDSINPGTTRTYMQEEFERVSLNIDDSNQYEAALLPCNVTKNRYPEVLPYELTRVKLWPYSHIEGSDYINASFIDGYQQRQAYILTQSPLENTVEEFWRMLWEYEIFTIVMISSTKERSKHHCYPYWPLNNEPTLFGILGVQLAAEEEKVGFIRREFRVSNSKNGDSRTISHFMYFDWPTEGSPDTASAIEMIGQVQKTQQQTGNSAIVIHCSDGSGRSGSLAALMYCLERLKLEGLVDVFQTVRAMRTQRIGLVQSLEQYHFVYMAVSNFLDCFSNYANFK